MRRPSVTVVVLTFYFVFIGIMIYLGTTIPDDDHKQTSPKVTVYEDHSGRIEFDGAVCVLPAFDSPEDEIKCYPDSN